MSKAIQTDNTELLDEFGVFLRRYYADEINELAGAYPAESRSLQIDWSDLYRFDDGYADGYLEQPQQFDEYLKEALRLYDLPIDISLTDAHVRVKGLNSEDIIRVGDIRRDHVGKYVGITADINRVSEIKPKIEEAAFECQRCGTLTYVPQTGSDFQEPHECQGCQRQGPFAINFDQSEFVDFCMVEIKQPPGEASRGNGTSIVGHIDDDLVDVGGEHGLQGRAGESATIYGIVRLEQETSGRQKQPVFNPYLDVRAIEFDTEGEDDIDVDKHLPTIRDLSQEDGVHELFARSIATQLPFEDDWKKIKLAGVAYLFGSFRVDPDDGPLYRGDIHTLLMGDPGTGKTTFLDDIAEISPKCERRSATGLSSEVGLTAAAVQDKFDNGSFALEPGVLVRANNGHCIISELDKGPDELNRIHDALEREQRITVDKADIHAELNTRTGLLADANPVEGRFDPTLAPAAQFGIDPALISRMDLIIPMIDVQKVEKDETVGDHLLASYSEAAAMERAERTGESTDVGQDVTEREIDLDVMRAWVQYARGNIFPLLTRGAKERLLEFYVDTRDDTATGDGGTITVRTLEAGVRLATAFARVELSDTVEPRHAETAIGISRWAIGKTFDTDTGEFNADWYTEVQGSRKSQQTRVSDVKTALQNGQSTIDEIVDETGLSEQDVEHQIDKLMQKGEAYEPETGVFSST